MDVEALQWPAKDPGDKLDYGVNFEPSLANVWKAGTTYATTSRIRPNRSTGYEYECTTAGQSANREPSDWPIVIGATKTDGSVTWTCRALSTSSLRTTVASVTWNADTGITVSGQTLTGQIAAAYIEGGTDGEDYTVLIKATMADGTSTTAVCILSVRRAVRLRNA